MEFDGILDEIRENKTAIIVILVLMVAIIIASIFNLFFKKREESIDMEETMKVFAQTYYENIHYVEAKSLYGDYYVDRLKLEKEDGIKLTLRGVVQVFEDVSSESFYKEGLYCDFVDTYAIIYPKYPYGEKDYEIETNVSCAKTLD